MRSRYAGPVVHVLSGGLDSTVLLGKLIREGRKVFPLTFDYGQRHVREVEAAHRICAFYEIGHRHRVVKMDEIGRSLMRGSALTNEDIPVPHGHYEHESMKSTVVPNRNLIFCALASAYALSHKFEEVTIAVHAGDHAIYPDCRSKFYTKLNETLKAGSWGRVRIRTPFIGYTKAQIVRTGCDLAVPLDLTWTCYEGGERHCGRCGTCVERREAFELAHVPDPTIYMEGGDLCSEL